MRKTLTILLTFIILCPALLTSNIGASSPAGSDEVTYSLEQVYSLKEALAGDPSEHYSLLAGNQEVVVYTNGNPDEDGYLHIFSNAEQRIVSRINFPNENIFDATIFNNGILFVRTPRGTLSESRSETAQTIFTISYYSSTGDVSDLWTGQCIHPSALPRIQVVGQNALFAYDDLNASTLHQAEVIQTNRIGRIDPELNIHWLLDKNARYQADGSHFRFASTSRGANFGHFPMLYSKGNDSFIYDYHAIDGSLDEIHLPGITIENVFPLRNGELLLSILKPGTDASYIYLNLDLRDEVTRIHVPETWKLMNILPLENSYLWLFDDGQDRLLLGDKPDPSDIAGTDTDPRSQGIRDYAHSFSRNGVVYLLAEDVNEHDIELYKVKDLNAESLPMHAVLSTEVPRRGVEELGPEIEKIMQKYGYGENVYGMLLSDTTGNTLYEHRADQPFTAASTVKIYALIWVIDAINEGLITPQTPIPYYHAMHYEGGTGSLQLEILEGETRTVSELVELALTESDNIAFHMIDQYRLNFANQIATFRMADRFDLAVSPEANVLTPKDLQKAYVYLYERMHDPFVTRLLDMARDSGEPELFPTSTASHKPGDVVAALADAGIYWNEGSPRGPIFYSIMLGKTDQYEELFAELSALIMETVY